MKHRAKRARRAGGTLLTFGLGVAVDAALLPTAEAATPPPTVTAKSAYLYDDTANEKLWGKYSNTERSMASTTKVMTAVVVFGQQDLNLDRKITVKQAYRDYVSAHGASTADLKTGDVLTVRQVLYGMMLPSGCDAAMALADTYGKGTTIKARVQSFITQMNRKAAALGMTHTVYDSFDGISTTGQNHTTARDATVLATKALTYRTLRTVVAAKRTVQTATNGRTYTWYNTNQLLGTYEGALGIKTGTGSSAGPCLVFAARRDGRTVAGVVLNSATSSTRYEDATEMLDYAFSG